MKKLITLLLFCATFFASAQIQTINVGTSPDDHTGDPIRTAFTKTNANFTLLNKILTATGTNTYIITMTPALTSYINLKLYVIFANANTGASTVKINSLSILPLKKHGADALVSGDIPAGHLAIIAYDGVNMQLLNPATGSGGGGGITNSAANTELMLSNGTNAISSGLFSPSYGVFNFGDASHTGDRTLSAINTAGSSALNLVSGTAGIFVNTKRINLAGDFTTSGANALTLTTTGSTSITLPTSGTLVALPGSSSITTLGSIASGTWSSSATTIAAGSGGTGQSSYTTGDLLYASASNALSKLNATTNGFVLTLSSGLPVWAAAAGGGGTVTSASVVTANGVSGSVANPTTTPAITLSLGAITPTTVNGITLSGSSSPALTVNGTTSIAGTHSGTSSGTNMGDQTITLTGPVTGSGTGSFATTIASSINLPGSPTTTTQGALDNSTKISTTAYTDAAVAAAVSGASYKPAVRLSTIAALPANTYSNGSSGVGATLTGVSFGALSVDGTTTVSGDYVLVKNEATASHNGIYTVTTVGGVATLYVLTRRSDYNSTANIHEGDAVFTEEGGTINLTTWVQTTSGSITVGTTSIVFAQIGGIGALPQATSTVTGVARLYTSSGSNTNGPMDQNSATATFMPLDFSAQSAAGALDGEAEIIPMVQSAANVKVTPNQIRTTANTTQTADYTLVLGDAWSTIYMNKATAINLTVPPNSSVAYRIGTKILVRRTGAGQLTFVQGSSVIITSTLGALTDGGLNVINVLTKDGTNTWKLDNGIPVSISSSDVTGALGYTPAKSTSVWTKVLVTSDVIATGDTNWHDITGLSFSITNGQEAEFQFRYYVVTGSNTEGFGVGITGPTLTTLWMQREATSSASAFTPNMNITAYDSDVVTTTSINGTGNRAQGDGRLITSASGTAQMRFRCETGTNSITIKAGSYVEYRLLTPP